MYTQASLYGGTMGLVQRSAGHAFFHRLGAGRLLGTICVASHTEGFERFVARLPDVARCIDISGVRGIPRLARELARAKAPFVRFGIGFSRHANGGQAVRAVLTLPALVGAFRRGGALFETWEAFDFDLDVLRRPDLLAPPTRQVNMVRLGEALTADDRLRSLFVYQCNPAAVAPDQTAVRRGLARRDLFVVVHEQMFTDTTDFADVVLPAPTSLETSDVYRSYGHYYLLGPRRGDDAPLRAVRCRRGKKLEVSPHDRCGAHPWG